MSYIVLVARSSFVPRLRWSNSRVPRLPVSQSRFQSRLAGAMNLLISHSLQITALVSRRARASRAKRTGGRRYLDPFDGRAREVDSPIGRYDGASNARNESTRLAHSTVSRRVASLKVARRRARAGKGRDV